MEYIKKKKAGTRLLLDFKKRLTTAQKKTPYSNLGSDKAHTALKKYLQEEQGYLCAYCQGSISDKEYYNDDEKNKKEFNFTIEHYKPRSIYSGAINSSNENKLLCEQKEKFREDLRIEYSNLLGVCNDKRPNEHCDSLKNDKELCYIPNPASDEFKIFQSRLKYSKNGKIYYKFTDEEINKKIDKEIKDILNLNEEEILKRRKDAWKAVRKRLTKNIGIIAYHDWNKDKKNAIKILEREINFHFNYVKGTKQFNEFRGFIIHRLNWLLKYLVRS